MSIEIIVVLIALFGTVLGAVIGFKPTAKRIYNKTITEERIKWLNKVREDYSK